MSISTEKEESKFLTPGSPDISRFAGFQKKPPDGILFCQ
jgi:hypothetical protein